METPCICTSTRFLRISSHQENFYRISLDDRTYFMDNLPEITNMADYNNTLNLKICADCGRVPGVWPLPLNVDMGVPAINAPGYWHNPVPVMLDVLDEKVTLTAPPLGTNNNDFATTTTDGEDVMVAFSPPGTNNMDFDLLPGTKMTFVFPRNTIENSELTGDNLLRGDRDIAVIEHEEKMENPTPHMADAKVDRLNRLNVDIQPLTTETYATKQMVHIPRAIIPDDVKELGVKVAQELSGDELLGKFLQEKEAYIFSRTLHTGTTHIKPEFKMNLTANIIPPIEAEPLWYDPRMQAVPLAQMQRGNEGVAHITIPEFEGKGFHIEHIPNVHPNPKATIPTVPNLKIPGNVRPITTRSNIPTVPIIPNINTKVIKQVPIPHVAVPAANITPTTQTLVVRANIPTIPSIPGIGTKATANNIRIPIPSPKQPIPKFPTIKIPTFQVLPHN